MRMMAMAALPGAVERAYMVGSTAATASEVVPSRTLVLLLLL